MTRVCLAILLAATLAGCTSRAGHAVREIDVALPTDRITWLPVQLAQDLGYAHEEGLRFAIAETNALGKGMEALVGGSVEVTAGTLSQVMQLAAEGRRVRCFVTLYTRSAVVLAVAPAMSATIRDVHTLAGRNVGIASQGSASHQFLEFWLASQGVAPDTVHAISVGTAAPSLAALEYGKVDAGVLLGAAIPTYERRHPDARILVDTRTAEGARQVFGAAVSPNTCLIASDDWLDRNPDTARRLARAVVKAMHWMKDQSAEEIRARMPAAFRIPDAEAELIAIRQVRDTLTADGAMSAGGPEGMWRYVATFSSKVRAARIDLASTYTNRFVTDR